VIPKYIAS